LGHLAWFHEKWVLRQGGKPSVLDNADALYDSAAVAHDSRWDLPLPSRQQTLHYAQEVEGRIFERLGRPGLTADELYFILLGVFHEDMHGEAFTYTRQTLAYPPPRLSTPPPSETAGGPLPGDVPIPGGPFRLGAEPGEPFVFDNEKWAHEVPVAPFAIARAPVTQAEFAAFVDDRGYLRQELWDAAGWHWRQKEDAVHPVYWRRQPGGWLRRDFDRWVPLEPHRPVLHVSWYEASAYCHWAGRRLPSEAEWELAVAGSPKRRFPWGNEPPAGRANLDSAHLGCVDVAAFADGDSPFGCRQMIGNVWEWTASDFLPYPGFVVDPYREYSQPWFGTHKVLRGGCWASRGRLLRNTWRNFYLPGRRDIWAGFRTCSLAP
jgi:iron(II)-dependent oxidoreductase